MTRILALAMWFLAASPAFAVEPVLTTGEELETRLDADFDGNGVKDIAYITRAQDKRALHVSLADNGSDYLPLDPYPLGGGSLTFVRDVLVFEDLTGGTTAYAVTRRYRFERTGNRMRLIGLDATLYSRTFAHDGFELSWNLLTGELITRELRLNRKGGNAAYDPIIEKTAIRRSGRVWLFDTPAAEALITEVSGR